MPQTRGQLLHQMKDSQLQGNGSKFLTTDGTGATDKWPILFDAFGKAIGEQPRGNTTVVQMADQTGGFVLNDLLAFDVSGNAKDSGLLSTNVVTSPGGGEALTVTGYGSWYGQVPRGATNGTNTVFHLDYKLVNPYAILMLNGVSQLPGVQGDPSSLTATMAVPNSEFSITDWTLTVNNPPKAGEYFYIWYFRADPIAHVASATINLWSSFTAEDGIPHGSADATYHLGSGGASLYHTNLLFALRQDSEAIPSFPVTVAEYAGSYITFLIDGTLSANAANEINIYDCYISLILEDASVFTLRPVSWGFTSGSDGSLNSWAPGTGYGLGTKAMDSNGNIQQCIVPGTSGSTPPIWAVSGNTIDGGVTWSYVGPASSQTSTTGQIVNPTLAYDADATPPTTFATFTRIHYSGLSDGGVFTLFF